MLTKKAHFINILLLYYFINIIIFCGTLIYFCINNMNVFVVIFDEYNVSLVNNMIYFIYLFVSLDILLDICFCAPHRKFI